MEGAGKVGVFFGGVPSKIKMAFIEKQHRAMMEKLAAEEEMEKKRRATEKEKVRIFSNVRGYPQRLEMALSEKQHRAMMEKLAAEEKRGRKRERLPRKKK